MAVSATSGVWKFAPLIAVGGVALAVGAWVLPIPGLSVRPSDSAIDPGVTPPEVPGRRVLPNIPSHDWTMLVERLQAERPDVPKSTSPIIEDPDEGKPNPIPRGLLAAWRFSGAISEPGGMVAIVSINDRQRYFRMGQIVTLGDGVTQGEIIRLGPQRTDDDPDQDFTFVVVKVEGEEQRVDENGPMNPGSSKRPNPATRRGRNAPSDRS